MNRNAYQLKQRKAIQAVANLETKGHIIEPCDNFRADPRRCLTGICFVPLNLALKLEKEIIDPLRQIEPWHHYYRINELHVTLQPIRKIANPPTFHNLQVQAVLPRLKTHFSGFSPIPFDLEGLVQFPTSCAVPALCGPELEELLHAGNQVLDEIGFANDKTYPEGAAVFGNITFCRFSKPPGKKFEERIQLLSSQNWGQMVVSEVCIVDCNAVCAAESRKILGKFQLGSA